VAIVKCGAFLDAHDLNLVGGSVNGYPRALLNEVKL